jgi:hypothetical protein
VSRIDRSAQAPRVSAAHCRRSVGEQFPEGYRERPKRTGREAPRFRTSRALSPAFAHRPRHHTLEVGGSTPIGSTCGSPTAPARRSAVDAASRTWWLPEGLALAETEEPRPHRSHVPRRLRCGPGANREGRRAAVWRGRRLRSDWPRPDSARNRVAPPRRVTLQEQRAGRLCLDCARTKPTRLHPTSENSFRSLVATGVRWEAMDCAVTGPSFEA